MKVYKKFLSKTLPKLYQKFTIILPGFYQNYYITVPVLNDFLPKEYQKFTVNIRSATDQLLMKYFLKERIHPIKKIYKIHRLTIPGSFEPLAREVKWINISEKSRRILKKIRGSGKGNSKLCREY